MLHDEVPIAFQSFPEVVEAPVGFLCSPDEPELVRLFELRFDAQASAFCVSPPYFPKSFWGHTLGIRDYAVVPKRALLELLSKREREAPQWKWENREPMRSSFIARCETLLDRIRAGRLKKAVPIAFLEAEKSAKGDAPFPSSRELAHLVHEALQSHSRSGGYLYGLFDRNSGILGITPEVLLEKRGRHVRTVALAGTRSASSDGAEEDLLKDAKEAEEHSWVVEGIAEAFTALGLARIGERRVRRAGDLLHLETPIEVELNREQAWEDLVERLHPTPALGAFPKNGAGREFLAEQEKECPRSRFGAPLGLVTPDQELFIVAIRNLEWSRSANFCRVGAGAGVVAASNPEKEWNEIQAKWRSTRKLLGLPGDPTV